MMVYQCLQSSRRQLFPTGTFFSLFQTVPSEGTFVAVARIEKLSPRRIVILGLKMIAQNEAKRGNHGMSSLFGKQKMLLLLLFK
jgi:hypothetical protein